jgi:hypothetical protein
MIIRMFKEHKEELKEDIQNNSINPKKTWMKVLRRHRKN